MKSLTALARTALASCLGLLLPLSALASEGSGFPSRPVTLVVPFPPGGATDVNARLIAQHLGKALGQPVVIENRAGAGTVVGASYVAKAAPDGYTLLVSSGTTFTVNPAIRRNLPYDPVKSFEPIGLAGRVGMILLANAEVPVRDMKQFVAYVKAAPGKYSYASYGTGTTAQFAGETLLHAAGLKMTHVPYKGSAPAMNDLMGGQVPFAIDTVSAAIPQLRSGKIRAIAVTTAKRSTLLPDVPTMAESGLAEMDMDTWLAVAAPRGLPAEVRAKLEQALAATINDSDTRARLAAQGMEPAFAGGEAVSALIAWELPLMRAVAARANITAD